MKVFVGIPPIAELYPHSHVCAGLRALGHEVVGFDQQLNADILVTWSPWKRSRREALYCHYSGQGRPVIVMENGWLSPVMVPPIGCEQYFQAALGGWNGTGSYPVGGPGRWESWGLTMSGWTNRQVGRNGYALVIGQRGHPHDARSAPPSWEYNLQLDGVEEKWIMRRPRDYTMVPLAKHLAGAAEVHVWTSNAATHALLDGVPVIQHGPNLMTSELVSRPGQALQRGDRRPVFERLAWGQWTAPEIGSGEPFARLLAPAHVIIGDHQ